MLSTKPVFIVGSGRSGTRTLFRMLSGMNGIEIHHEYAVPEMQKIACLYFMGKISEIEVMSALDMNHGAAIEYSNSSVWADSSNKLLWIIDVLSKKFPNAKFLGVVRDGRKVVPSYYYKLREEMYDDESVLKLRGWLNGDFVRSPPAEKKYWWNIPNNSQPWGKEFLSFNRFQRVCYHWAFANSLMKAKFKELDNTKSMIVRLEDLKSDKKILAQTIDFIGIKFDDFFTQYLEKPRNVFYPVNYKLTEEQKIQFNQICGKTMSEFGYDTEEEYHVKY